MLHDHLSTFDQSTTLYRSQYQPSRASRLITIISGLAALVVVGIGFVAYQLGILGNLLFLLPPVAVLLAIVSRGWSVYRKTLEWGLLRHLLRHDMRPYILQCLNRWACWVLIAITMNFVKLTLGAPSDDIRVRQYQFLIWGCTGLLMLLALIPPKRTRLTTHLLYTVAWVFLSIELLRIVQGPAGAVAIDPPFRGEWYVFQGGRSALISHHYSFAPQRDALDLIIAQDGSMSRGDASLHTSYFAFGQTLYAPADGRVVKVVDDRPEQRLGQMDPAHPAGNYVVIDIGKGQFVMLGHLRQGSIRLHEGSVVQRGQPVAETGNTGNSSAPHLHMQIQDRADFYDPELRTFPILFRDVTRVRNDVAEHMLAADVRRDDRVVTALP